MKTYVLLLGLVGGGTAFAQAPQGYYDAAAGLNGQPLKAALHHIIKDHDALTYNQLWIAFTLTDKKANNKVWDIYSDIPGGTPPYEHTFNVDQCGSSINNEGDCYNREHSWPRSYFNEGAPMESDLFHIYPTDGYVNGKRADLPYGVVDTTQPFYQSLNGSRSGTNIYPGYSGTVFEPIDSFKGDLARSYFYMTTRYYGEDSGWDSWAMANGAELKQWAIDMLMDWHHNDPVSAKEIDRNNAIFDLQENRNPFIDYPEFADCIWGNATCSTTVSIASVNVSKKIKVYPNPAASAVTVDWSEVYPEERVAVDLMNIQGQLLYHKDINTKATSVTLDTRQFSGGIYWIRIQSGTMSGYSKVVLR